MNQTQTVYQQLACVKRTGHTFIIKPFEKVLDVTDKGNQIIVAIKYVTLQEKRAVLQVEETGTRLVAFIQCPKSGSWSKTCISAPDDEPDFDFVRVYGSSITPEVHNSRIDWATICHRPGTANTPLDNETRTRDYPELTTSRMRKHWSLRSA